MIKTLLVNPSYAVELYGEKVLSSHPPLGLGYLAAYLRERKFLVEILDANAYRLSDEETIQRIMKSNAKIIGLTSTTSTIDITFRLCKKIKKKDTSKIIVVGGVHITFLPEKSLRKCPEIDYIVIGEGEKIFYNLVKAIKTKKNVKKIKGIAFIERGKFIQTPPEELIKDLNQLSFPARDLLPNNLYKPGSEFDIGCEGEEYTEIITSRGCPNKCVYCSSAHFWKRLRIRSVENIFQEIKEVHKKGVKHLSFLDDTFTISEKIVIGLCKKMEPLKIKWDCYIRVNITEKMIKAMKKAGCVEARVGFESGNNEVLKRIKKNTTKEQARKAMKLLKKYGIKTYGFFMIGLPGENEKEINDTINFAIELDPHIASFGITTPFPGTEMYEDYKKRKWIPKEMNWKNMTIHSSELTRTDSLGSEQIYKLYKKAKKKFFLRPKFVYNMGFYFFKNPKKIFMYFKRLIKRFL